MRNLWLNWRFGNRHLQIGTDKPYITFRPNPYRIYTKYDTWFERY